MPSRIAIADPQPQQLVRQTHRPVGAAFNTVGGHAQRGVVTVRVGMYGCRAIRDLTAMGVLRSKFGQKRVNLSISQGPKASVLINVF